MLHILPPLFLIFFVVSVSRGVILDNVSNVSVGHCGFLFHARYREGKLAENGLDGVGIFVTLLCTALLYILFANSSNVQQ